MSLAVPDDRTLRTTFDAVAATYADVRPPFPPDLIAVLRAMSGAPEGGRVLEVGCGPGNLTELLAGAGFAVTAVELGAHMVAVARERLRRFEAVQIVHSSFEGWPLPAEPFDLVVAANAWHWLDPAVALDQAARALRPDGALAIVGGGDVAGGDTEFFRRAQRCYEAHMPGVEPGEQLRDPATITHGTWGIEQHDAFAAPAVHRWVETHDYTTESYFALIGSFSTHLALDDEHRTALYACLRDLLDGDYGGHVTRATMTELCVARRVDGSGADRQ